MVNAVRRDRPIGPHNLPHSHPIGEGPHRKGRKIAVLRGKGGQMQLFLQKIKGVFQSQLQNQPRRRGVEGKAQRLVERDRPVIDPHRILRIIRPAELAHRRVGDPAPLGHQPLLQRREIHRKRLERAARLAQRVGRPGKAAALGFLAPAAAKPQDPAVFRIRHHTGRLILPLRKALAALKGPLQNALHPPVFGGVDPQPAPV